jgi:hypothetical protein
MLLHIKAVLQAQRPKVILGKLTSEETACLVTELLHALRHQALIYIVVSIHNYLFLNNI